MIPKEHVDEYLEAVAAAVFTVATKHKQKLNGFDISGLLVCVLASIVGEQKISRELQAGLLTDYITRVLLKNESSEAASESSSD